jgi:hypothetical protein
MLILLANGLTISDRHANPFFSKGIAEAVVLLSSPRSEPSLVERWLDKRGRSSFVDWIGYGEIWARIIRWLFKDDE